MRIAVFSTKSYDEEYLTTANRRHGHDLTFFEARLDRDTAALASGFSAVCCFVNDTIDADVLRTLAVGGTRLVALRSAGFNHVDLRVADELGMAVARVPAYSPHAVAEHAAGLILSLNRKIHRAYARVREGNFSLQGLLGFDLHQRTVGVIGTGKIGSVFARIMAGFGCQIVAYDPYPSPRCQELGVEYVPLEQLFERSDIIALHLPLTPSTHHLIDADALGRMRDGVMLVNTSRGALVDTKAVIDALKSGQLGSLALDVYEEEAALFFEDLSDRIISDDVFSRLLTFPNVLITSHQGFFTAEAMADIAETTLANVSSYERDGRPRHEVTLARPTEDQREPVPPPGDRGNLETVPASLPQQRGPQQREDEHLPNLDERTDADGGLERAADLVERRVVDGRNGEAAGRRPDRRHETDEQRGCNPSGFGDPIR